MTATDWGNYADLDSYEVVGVGRTWWDVMHQAADRLGVPQDARRQNRPTGFRVVREEAPQIYADDAPEEAWVVMNAQAHQARPLMTHADWGPKTPWVLLWLRSASERHG